MPATATKTRRISLREDIARAKPEKVDRDKGIIYGVKVIGLTSDNDRRYTQDALRRAIPLYEGCPVRIDHPIKANENRPVTSTFGRLVNVREDKAGGLRADLEFIKSHDLAEFVCELAERMSEQLGLSHNAQGEGKEVNGIFEVREISDVRSVDLVTAPASTANLFEQRRQPMKIFERVEQLFPRKEKTAAHRRLVKLLETAGYVMDDEAPDELMAPADALPAEVAAEGDWKADLVAAIGKLVGSEDTLDHDMARKIMAMLKPAGAATEKPVGEEEGEEKDDEKAKETPEEEDEEKDKKDEAVKESRELKAKVAALQADAHVRDLCEELNVKPSPQLRKALASLDTDKDRRVLLEDYKSATAKPAPGKPRTQIPSGGNGQATSDDSDLVTKGLARLGRRLPSTN